MPGIRSCQSHGPVSYTRRTTVSHATDPPLLRSHHRNRSADDGSAAIVTESASCLAGSMCMNTLSLPLRLYLLSLVARPSFEAVERRLEKIQQGPRV